MMSIGRAKRNHRENDECRNQRNDRSQREDPAVGAIRNDVFLQHQLEAVGDRLKQALRTNAHRSEPDLHERDDFALQQREVRDDTGKCAENDTNLDERNQNVIDCKIPLPVDFTQHNVQRSDNRNDVRHHVADHHLLQRLQIHE